MKRTICGQRLGDGFAVLIVVAHFCSCAVRGRPAQPFSSWSAAISWWNVDALLPMINTITLEAIRSRQLS
eukprot:1853106-Rhodomonas_salina.1